MSPSPPVLPQDSTLSFEEEDCVGPDVVSCWLLYFRDV